MFPTQNYTLKGYYHDVIQLIVFSINSCIHKIIPNHTAKIRDNAEHFTVLLANISSSYVINLSQTIIDKTPSGSL